MRKGVAVLITVAIVLGAFTAKARAKGYNLTANGTLQASTGGTTCGAQLGDAYDTFCPSDPITKTTCNCESYNANVNGNLAGMVTDLSGALNLTVDSGGEVGTPDCQPIFGELAFIGSKDTETIYLNGSHCAAQANGDEAFLGGWGMFSSTDHFT